LFRASAEARFRAVITRFDKPESSGNVTARAQDIFTRSVYALRTLLFTCELYGCVVKQLSLLLMNHSRGKKTEKRTTQGAALCGIEFAASARSKMSQDGPESGDEHGETV
jgi:hypothetical protein